MLMQQELLSEVAEKDRLKEDLRRVQNRYVSLCQSYLPLACCDRCLKELSAKSDARSSKIEAAIKTGCWSPCSLSGKGWKI